jgi:uncharacterized membrane-anchored protein YjiN (DUF445 family)
MPSGRSDGNVPLANTPAPFRPDDPEDIARRQRLRRNRAVATGLLGFMGAASIATHLVDQPDFGIMLLRAGAEAGVVGGLADWFAVTALFRHPLGLRIPHTAIVPSNKDRIGRTLGRFVERNFLTQEAVLRKLRDAHVGRRFAAWLASPETASMIAGSIVSTLPYLIHSLRDRDLHEFANQTLREQLLQADIAPLLGRAIRLLTASGEADVLFERLTGLIVQWLESHRPQIDQAIHERSRWWIPRAIDRRIAAAIVQGVSDLLNGLRDPNGELRQKFRDSLSQFIDELVHSPQHREQINESKNRIINHPDVQAWLTSIGNEISAAMLEDLTRPSSKTRLALEKTILIVGQTLVSGQAMQQHIESFLERLAIYLVAWRGEIGNFIADVVKRWDVRTVSERLELVVGSDLQYIRINGTIVGGLAGSAIFLAGRLLA